MNLQAKYEIEFKGFQAEYDGELEGCGGVIRKTSGSLHSPQYPDDYPENMHCEWEIITRLS